MNCKQNLPGLQSSPRFQSEVRHPALIGPIGRFVSRSTLSVANCNHRDFSTELIATMALTAQRYRIRRRISQLRFLDSAPLQPVCEVGRRRIVALRDELLGGPVGKQRLDFRTVLVQLAFAGAFRPSDRQAGSPSRAKGFFRPRGDQPCSISAVIFPPKSRSKSSPKIGRRQIDDIYAVSIGYRKSYGGFGTFEPLGPGIPKMNTYQAK